MMEIWHPVNYEPAQELGSVGLTESANGLIIKVEDGHKIFSFIYDQKMQGKFVEAVRFMDEVKGSYLLKEATHAREKYSDNRYKGWHFYKSTNSDFIDWYDHLPGPGTDVYPIQHHVISTVELTYEILSMYEPRIEVEKL